MQNLDEVLKSLIQKHSSPTIGKGDVHGDQPGYIIYENEIKFIIAGLRMHLQAVSHAQDESGRAKREWKSPVKTIGDLVNNLLGLDQNNEIYGAYHLDLGSRKECKTRGISMSRERVLPNGRIDAKDPNSALTGYSTVIWSSPDPRWDHGITLQAQRPGIDRWFDVHPDEVELLCNDGCFIRAIPKETASRTPAESDKQ